VLTAIYRMTALSCFRSDLERLEGDNFPRLIGIKGVFGGRPGKVVTGTLLLVNIKHRGHGPHAIPTLLSSVHAGNSPLGRSAVGRLDQKPHLIHRPLLSYISLSNYGSFDSSYPTK
jgi:hypothetical protein